MKAEDRLEEAGVGKRELAKRYYAGESIRGIAASLGISPTSLYRIATDWGIQMRPRGYGIQRAKKGAPRLEVRENAVVVGHSMTYAELAQRYCDGERAHDLAALLGIAESTLGRKMRAAGIIRVSEDERRRFRAKDQITKNLDNNELAARFRSGESIDAIAESIGMTKQTIIKRIRAAELKRMSSNGTSNPVTAELVRRYEDGETIRALSVSFNMTTAGISEKLYSAGVEIRPAAPKLIDLGITDEELIKRYKAGESMADLGRSLNLNLTTIKRRLKKAEIELRSRGASKRLNLGVSDEELAKRYEAGESVSAISRSLGFGWGVIKRRLDDMGIEIRPAGSENRPVDLGVSENELVARYTAGESIGAIGRSLGRDRETIRRRLKDAGVLR
ncbi:helix-turn-helix domain-containing protein [Nonomuraea sp. NEAU-A123]|uniref:helix-turn-helix domain-containing protein n=1 Tax=Nonomuraea sp. NEAU-A123 TaxID=2839649 RepID=UPI001BE43E97|nr:hypothetical protein [Nonomuraea sp. NEAU-A123]MBT2225996.1 hypothetical protein [Nonomuraea sp. NEAU-A123]